MKYGAINIDPETMGDTHFYRNRCSYPDSFDYMEGGDDLTEFLDDYPGVSKEVAIVEMGKE